MAVLGGASTAIGAKLEVAVFTPVGSPAVLDEPVLGAALLVALSITDDGDRVVDIVVIWIAAVAVFVMDDSTAITSQAIVVRVDSDSDRVGGNELLQSLVADHVLFMPST